MHTGSTARNALLLAYSRTLRDTGAGKLRSVTRACRSGCHPQPRLRPLTLLWNFPRVAVLLGVLAFLLIPGTRASENLLPSLGDAASGVLSPAQETELGQSLLREIRRHLPLENDPELVFYLNSLGKRLLSSADAGHASYQFLLVQQNQLNAFAMPGGIVGVYTGLLLAVRDEAELAGVLAHEIAHVTQRHLARRFSREREVSVATGLAVLAGILAASIDPQLAQAAITGGLAAGIQSRIDYSRVHEAEADRIGQQILARAGFDPQALADFFEQLQFLTRGTDATPEYLRTHPLTLGRISDARNRAESITGDFAREVTGSFHWMQARIRALTDPHGTLAQIAATPQPTAQQIYAAVVAHLHLGNLASAQQRFTQLDPQVLPNLHYLLLQVALLRQAGTPLAALPLLEEWAEIYPNHPLLLHITALTAAEAGQYARAIRLFNQRLREESAPEPELLRAKADAAAASGQQAISLEAMAEYFLHRGQYAEAIRLFGDALTASDLRLHDAERIEHKRERARQAMAKMPPSATR
jgi:predicted Zn-dependent protease